MRRGFARWAGAGLAIALAAGAAQAQLGGPAIPSAIQLVRISLPPVAIQAGSTATVPVTLTIAPTWHINANPPSPDYMIPTQLAASGSGGVSVGAPIYPAARSLKVGFDENPLAVYDQQVVIRLPVTAAKTAVNGARVLKGTLTFQSCNDQVCLAPASVPFEIALAVSGGAAPSDATGPPGEPASGNPARAPPDDTTHVGADSTALGAGATPASGSFTTLGAARPATAVRNPISDALKGGGWGAFLTLFLIGLALNLTPCVYPMLGVTVSIFGARRAAPPLQVFGLALIYVLGMATMYSALGLAAALTGGMFGSALQSPVVSIGIGVLLIALSLSMFGFYEFQLPSALMARLGGSGTTSAAGVFFSGLLVGVFAAPCTGPPIVALLAVVGEKGDPWFGFLSFFTLSLGLGAPYLVLGTFSNLLQGMPRSGDWMVWVKKVFGVTMLSIGLFYLTLALAPRLSMWVVPVALVGGGLYLGYFEISARKRPTFQRIKWLFGAVAVLAGLWIIITTPRSGIAFREFDDAHLSATLASGRPAMLDFSADWCVPCHELERSTFSNRDVIARARAFTTYRVDLTSYSSPDAERWIKQYAIRGVPTVVFLSPGGAEVREARVEEFLPPAKFLERMDAAVRASQRAKR